MNHLNNQRSLDQIIKKEMKRLSHHITILLIFILYFTIAVWLYVGWWYSPSPIKFSLFLSHLYDYNVYTKNYIWSVCCVCVRKRKKSHIEIFILIIVIIRSILVWMHCVCVNVLYLFQENKYFVFSLSWFVLKIICTHTHTCW